MKVAVAVLSLCLAASPLAAQTLRDCDTFEANARNTYGPYDQTIRDYANGAIRVIALDVGEPASGSYHVMVTHPHPDEPWQHCTLISYQDSIGFGWLDTSAIEASYDPATGLSVTIPVEITRGANSLDDLLTITVNQATGAVVPALGGQASLPAAEDDK
jgi:hypothetical protein